MSVKSIACPKCGKIMEVQIKFPGLWMCPDYKKITTKNGKPIFKCTGMAITDKACQEFIHSILNVIQESN